MKDWSFTFIDKVDDLNLLRKREAFWQLKLIFNFTVFKGLVNVDYMQLNFSLHIGR